MTDGSDGAEIHYKKPVLTGEPPVRVEKIMVLGGGSAGWIAALTLARKLPGVGVTVVRSPDIGIIGVGEGTTAAFSKHFFQYLGLNTRDFYHSVSPTWKLGVKFLWGDRPFVYGFGSDLERRIPSLAKATGYYAHMTSSGIGPGSALMAGDRVFFRKPDGRPDLSQSHAFHIENESLVGWLEAQGRAAGVQVIEGKVSEVVTGTCRMGGTEQLGVHRLVLEDGMQLSAELFVDASGFRGELVSSALGVGRRDYGGSLFCNRAVIGGWQRNGERILPYTLAEAMDAGWAWQIEHRNWINRGYVYSSDFIDDDSAEKEFRCKNPRIQDTRIVRFDSYRLNKMWSGNVVAVGNASGFVEPLEATALQAICVQSSTLADCLVDSSGIPTRTLIDYYNRYNTRQWDDIRDFLAVHYCFNHSLGTEFWKACRSDIPLEGAEAVVDYYRDNGPSTLAAGVVLDPANSFGLEGYYSMLVGQGVPHQRPYVPDPADEAAWRKHSGELADRVAEAFTSEEAIGMFVKAGWLRS